MTCRTSTPTLNSQTKTLPPDQGKTVSPGPVRILGVDPGSRVTGYGLVDCQGEKISYVSSGCLRLAATDLPHRLHQIHADLQTLITRYSPAVVAIEQVFVNRNAASALKLGQARGAAICAAAGLEIAEYTPAEVKQAIVGHGRAAKVQVQHMVCSLLGLEGELTEDAADALAVALCHARFTGQPDLLVKWGKSRKRRRRNDGWRGYRDSTRGEKHT